MKKLIGLLIIGIFVLSSCDAEAQSGDANNSAQSTMSRDELVELLAEQAENGTVPDASETVSAPKGDEVFIKDKMFIAQTNDIYYNPENYKDKTIRYEGIFEVYNIPETGEEYYAVIRYGPACCEDDETAGFEVVWDGEYPEKNDWVSAAGILEQYEENGALYFRLVLSSLEVLPTRGEEHVTS